MDQALSGETEKATLDWLVEALGHARAEGQAKLVTYLEEVADEVVFEVEYARERGNK